jgi:hypothetical protein
MLAGRQEPESEAFNVGQIKVLSGRCTMLNIISKDKRSSLFCHGVHFLQEQKKFYEIGLSLQPRLMLLLLENSNDVS